MTTLTADKVSTTSYISGKQSVQSSESTKKYVSLDKSTPECDTFVKSNDEANKKQTTTVADKVGSLIGSVKDSVSYFVTNKASKDAKHTDILNNKEACDVTANISQNVYQKKASVIKGWKPFAEHENESTGFKAVAYHNGNNIIISYCGTDDPNDIASDTQMAMGKVPEQFKDANKFYEKICTNNPECNVILTGHSLGGSLAELVASKNESTAAVTFNAYGVEKIINSQQGKKLKMKDNHNSFNYIVDGDIVSNSSKHVGATTMVQKTQQSNHAIANYVNLWA